MSKEEKKGLSLRRGRKARNLEAFVQGAGEKDARPPKPPGKGIVWSKTGWKRKMTAYLDPDLAQQFEMWCVTHGHTKSEGVSQALVSLVKASE